MNSFNMLTTSFVSLAMPLWVNCVMNDYEINDSDLFGATADGSSNVKSLVVNALKIQYEWCPPHMLARAVANAFKRESEAGKFITEVNDCVQKVRDLSSNGKYFTQLQSMAGSKKFLKSFCRIDF